MPAGQTNLNYDSVATVWYKVTTPAGSASLLLALQLVPTGDSTWDDVSAVYTGADVKVLVDPGTGAANSATIANEATKVTYECPTTDAFPSALFAECAQYAVSPATTYAIQVSMVPWPSFQLRFGLLPVSASS